MKTLSIVAGLWMAAAACAQPAVFLKPEAHGVRAGAPIALSVLERREGNVEAGAWPRDLRWFYVRVGGTQENRGAEDMEQASPDGRLSVATPTVGVAMIGLDFAERTEEWSAEQVGEFAGHAGRAAAAEARTVRRLVSATTLVRVTDASGSTGDDATATKKAGQQVEIRPLMDPTAVEPGFDLAVRVYVEGDGVGGARVTATHVESAESKTFTCDSKGIGHFKVDRPGEWRVEFHELRDVRGRWVAASGSISFESPKGGGR